MRIPIPFCRLFGLLAAGLLLSGGCYVDSQGLTHGWGYVQEHPEEFGLAPTRVSAPGVVPGEELPIPPAYTGIFALQGLIDFDSLDGAAVDPAKGTVALFGHRSGPTLRPVAYLDLLATSLENDSPIFDLRWTPDSENNLVRALNDADEEGFERRLTHVFDQGRLTPLGEWWFGLGGAQVRTGMNRVEAIAAALKACGRKEDASILLTFQKYDETTDAGQTEMSHEYFKLLCRLLGIFDDIAVHVRKYDAGQIGETELFDATYPLYLGACAKYFDQDPAAYRNRYFAERRSGLDPEQARARTAAPIMSPENQKPWLRRIIFNDLFRNRSEIYVPPAQAAEVLGVAPRVYPLFHHLPPRSLLARIAFQADVLGKNLMVMPDLKNKIPRYRTYFEWRRTVTAAAGYKEGHLWFSPGGFEIQESPDGNSIHFGKIPVRINLRRKVDGKSVEDPLLRQYADELTGLYDDFAREFQVLHELREAMKVIAVADWLKKRGMNLSFPTEGRILWNPPREIPGIVQIIVAVKEGPVGMITWALGGIDWDGRGTGGGVPAWKFEKSADAVPLPRSDMTVRSLKETNDQLRRLDTQKTEVPTPWYTGECPAEGGQKALRYVELQKDELSQRTDAAAALAQLEKLKRLAYRLTAYDRMLNDLAKERTAAQGDLADLEKDARRAMKDFLDQTSGVLGTTASHSDALSKLFKSEPVQELKEASDLYDRIRDRCVDAEQLIRVLQEGKFDPEAWDHLSDRWNELEGQVKGQALGTIKANILQQLGVGEVARLRMGAAIGVGKAAISTGEIVALHGLISDLEARSGDQALYAKRLQAAREEVQKQFLAERAKYEAMLNH